jgi:hypothetical protein
MIQQDKDREAFEAWIGDDLINKDKAGNYIFEVESAWEAWQGARDHYVPKLTEKEAMEAAANAIRAAIGNSGSYGGSNPPTDREMAIAAIRAAGMRFKEEA